MSHKRIPQSDLDRMEARENATSEGPWEAIALKRCDGVQIVSCSEADVTICDMARWREPALEELFDNSLFMANARTDQPRLRIAYQETLAEIDELKAAKQ